MAAGNVNPARGGVAVAAASAQTKPAGAPSPKDASAERRASPDLAPTKTPQAEAKDKVAEKVANKLVKDAFDPADQAGADAADPVTADDFQAAAADGDIQKKVAEKVVEKVVQKVAEKVVEAVAEVVGSAVSSAISSTKAPPPASSSLAALSPAAEYLGQSTFTPAPAVARPAPLARTADAFEATGTGSGTKSAPRAKQAVTTADHDKKAGGGTKIGTTGGGDGLF